MTEEERLEYEKRSNGDHEQCYELRANGCDRLEILEQDAYTAAFDLEWAKKHQCEQGFEDGEAEHGYQSAIRDLIKHIESL